MLNGGALGSCIVSLEFAYRNKDSRVVTGRWVFERMSLLSLNNIYLAFPRGITTIPSR